MIKIAVSVLLVMLVCTVAIVFWKESTKEAKILAFKILLLAIISSAILTSITYIF